MSLAAGRFGSARTKQYSAGGVGQDRHRQPEVWTRQGVQPDGGRTDELRQNVYVDAACRHFRYVRQPCRRQAQLGGSNNEGPRLARRLPLWQGWGSGGDAVGNLSQSS